MPSHTYDAVVVGAGPNGLAAAITLAQAGYSVLLRESKDTVGGGVRSAELTLPGFLHDICSSVFGLGRASPFFNSLPLDQYEVEWVESPAPLAHPLDDGTAVTLERDVRATGDGLGGDAAAYRRLVQPLVADWDKLLYEFVGPLRLPPHYPFAMTRFGLSALQPAAGLARLLFREERARALFVGLGAHSTMSLRRASTAAFGLMLGLVAHVVGWVILRGGAQRLADALAAHLLSLGGEIITDAPVNSLAELPPARVVLMDVTPAQLLRIAGTQLPPGYRRRLSRYRYGPGVFKIDLALDGPIPWQAPQCFRAATIHIGGTFEEIVEAEETVWRGGHPDRPFVILVQPTLFDPTRAPADKHIVWAYCHVPHGSPVDMTERIEKQIERFAPGFRDRIIARSIRAPRDMEAYNSNYIGGDINGGVQDLFQLFTRPVFRLVPYSTPVGGLYLCSSSTPPGGGVHGLCGYYAARAALRDVFKTRI